LCKNKINSANNGLVKDAPELQTISFNGRVSEKLVQELSYSMIKTDITQKKG
jgi:hypothetical protein